MLDPSPTSNCKTGRCLTRRSSKKAMHETTQEQQAENTEQKTAPKSNEPSSNVAVAGLGETVAFADRTLTVNDIQRGYIFPSNIPKPTPGNEFIIANVTLTNTSSQPIPANSYNFESEDSTGARVRAQATKVPPDAIYLGTIAANGEQTGNLVFEVQQGDPTIRIVYRPGP